MNDTTKSVLRTLVPIVYALLIKFGFSQLGLGPVVLNDFATVIATGIVYGALRLVEHYAPQFGWLLGYPQQPKYVRGEVVSRHAGV